MSITINGDGDINATGNDIELNSTGTTDVTLAVGGGSVGVGTASPDRILHLNKSGTEQNVRAKFTNGTTGVGASNGFEIGINASNPAEAVLVNYENSPMSFFTNGSERATIDASGNLKINSSGNLYLRDDGSFIKEDGGLQIGNTSGTGTTRPIKFYTESTERMRLEGDALTLTNTKTGVTSSAMVYSNAQSGGAYRVRFDANSSIIGDIRVTTSSVSYNTTSDARLKENVVDLDGAIDRVKQIPVHRFNFIANPDETVDGFLAHEVQAVVPEAVSGTQNEVDEEGNPVYQGIDQSKVVPLLTQALKDAITKIETLETANADMLARIEALETPNS